MDRLDLALALAGRYAARVQADDPGIDLGEAPPILGARDRIEAAIAVCGMPGNTLPLSVVSVFGLLPMRRFGSRFRALGQRLAALLSAHLGQVLVQLDVQRRFGGRPSIGWSKRSLSMLIRGFPHLRPATQAHRIPDSLWSLCEGLAPRGVREALGLTQYCRVGLVAPEGRFEFGEAKRADNLTGPKVDGHAEDNKACQGQIPDSVRCE